MRKLLFGLLLLGCFIPVYAQTTPAPAGYSTFSITASAMPLLGSGPTVPATDLGQAFSVTNHFSLRADEIMAPGDSLDAYIGGFKYFIPTNFLSKTNLEPSAFQFYLTAGAGANLVTPTGGTTTKHVAVVAGGGVNYDPSNSGNFALNLIEVRYARLPGFQQNTVLISSGLKLTF